MSTSETDPTSKTLGTGSAQTVREIGLAGAVPIEGIGARLVANMTASLSIPTATSFRDIPVDLLVARRQQLNASIAPARLSFTHLIAYAVTQAAAVHPVVASHFAEIDGRPHRVDPTAIDLGLAVDVQGRDGNPFLVVPVVRTADELDFTEFVSRYDDLVGRARANRLSADDLAGASITLTNPGTLGTTASVPRLMPGQGAVVATGAIRQTGGGAVMTVSSTYDHRVIQGAESGRFLATLEEFLAGSDGFYESIAQDLGVPRSLLASPVRTAGTVAHTISTAGSPAGSTASLAEIAAGVDLVRSFRHFGHRAAELDPLGSPPPGDEALDPATWGLTAESLMRLPSDVLAVDLPGSTLAEILPELRRTYCGTIAYEVEHINNHEERAWLRRIIETGEHSAHLTRAERALLLERLTAVEAFERILGRTYLGQKRFSIEGLDVLVPMLDQLIELVGQARARTIEIGMSHRGRLSVMVHVLGVAAATIFDEFERGRPSAEADPPAEGETSDVKYHRGAHGVRPSAGGPVRVTISSNPSHLEAIDPVVEGRARAKQTDRSGPIASLDAHLAVPVLIHGDAAFAAQGVVGETFNLARLAGYTTGGTIHLIGDNQLGFTVEPRNGRSTDYASDLAKGFDVPIAHVNADDPEACLSAVQLAIAYRERFGGDFVIHVLGYRRHGHSEEDEPAYTQPRLYARIAEHPTVREIYMRRLVGEGAIELSAGEEMVGLEEARLATVRPSLAREATTGPEERSGEDRGAAVLVGPSRRGRRSSAKTRRTAVPAARLYAINEDLLRLPEGFTIHPKLAPQLERRRAALGPKGRVGWAQAEALALASLLLDGVPIRMTGQDTERGTFSQRHLVLHDAVDGRRFTPIEHLTGARAPMELHDSPLSELACLGFEYGYAVEAPDALVLWEAQYGDFANGAEVVIDQFIIAGLAKWGETSRLTMLLPHGYEGQGPEHSSARLERYLALGAEDNVRVANPTTPAQHFHLLRDQGLRPIVRPLVLMTPKGLLRLPAATSGPDELTVGHFEAVLDDPQRASSREGVHRLVLCSGRFYYDLLGSRRRAEAIDVAIARVELLYPFPADGLRRLIACYPALETVVWAQEEPRNMGARKFVLPEIHDLLLLRPQISLVHVSRPERSSPAEGYAAAHRAQQLALVDEAFG